MAAYLFARTPAFGCRLVVNATASTCSLPIAIALSDYKSSRSRKCNRLLHPTDIRTTRTAFDPDNQNSLTFFNDHLPIHSKVRTNVPQQHVYRNPQNLSFLRPPSERNGSGDILLRRRRSPFPKMSTWCRAGVPN